MSGKVYTMKEMKNIVTYLIEHQAYGEIRGKKMWVDYANSNATTRTWQSLKETFLKRILPDIHNPYYNLSREQIISFRQGYDVEQRDKIKLEFQPVGDNSKSDTESNKDNDLQIVTSSDEAINQGENNKTSNVTSKDITVPETCYKTVDDLRRDLESPRIDEQKRSTQSKLEELPSPIQNALKDFESDIEDVQDGNKKSPTTEGQDVSDVNPIKNTDKCKPDSVNGVEDKNANTLEAASEKEKPTEMKDSDNNTNKNLTGEVIAVESENKQLVEKETSHDILEISSTNNKDNDTTLNKSSENQETVITSMTSSVQPLTNSDTILPNNQEGLKVQTKNKNGVNNVVDTKNSNNKALRKRSSSAETVLIDNKRQKTDSITNTSDKNCAPGENESEPEIFDVNDSDNENVTQTQAHEDETNNENSRKSDDEVHPPQNPCLKSVSLFAEQFNKTKYSDSASDDNLNKNSDPKPSGSKEVKNDNRQEDKDEVVVLKSHSESESGEESPGVRRRISNRMAQAKRKKALANVFGLSSGAVSSRRNRKSSQNQMRRPHNVPQVKDETVSDSSEWTTDTEQDNYISPPRGRKNRMTKKYLKPKSTRILSLEEEGGLFVMYGKRIYPLVKDGRIVKNYVIYESNSDSGFEQDSYWKAKYAELRKKYEERKKSREPSERLREKRPRSVSREPCSPILQSSIRKNPPPVQSHDIHAPSTSKTHPAIEHKEAVIEHPVENKASSEKIMIKYTINNAEVQLEGHWPQICPIFDKVLDILPKKMEPQNEITIKNSNNLEVHEQPNVISSGQSTPVIVTGDPVVQEKIDKLESEIFKEIEEKDKEEQIEHEKQANTDYVNVTNRKRGRPSKQSTSPGSPNKQPKPSPPKKDTSTQYVKNTTEVIEKQDDVQKSPEIMARRTRRSMKAALDAKDEPKPTRGSSKQDNITQGTKEEQVRYKFPQNMPQTTNNKIQRPRSFADRIVYQDDDSLIISESTQGYQDSDISPVKLKRNRKSKRSTIAHRNKLQSKRYQRRTYPYLIQDASTDSRITSSSGSLKSKVSQKSSDIYKSDSYQHLFPRTKLSFNRLEPISEKSPTVNEVEMRPVETVCRNQINTDSMDSDILTNDNIGVGSSSNVSLPQSPELSIVEDITMGKELLNNIKDYHSMKDAQANEVIMAEEQNKFLISEVDITIPLMEQKCVLKRNNSDLVLKNSNKINRKKKTSVSESLLNKIDTVHINDNSSVSDSLDIQLRNLLLESAKKMRKTSQSKENNMEIDENVINTMQKPKAKRRCSTPRKKETVKPKLSTKTTIEEHLETCSHRGRKSCPPSMQIQNENSVNINEINEDMVEEVKNKPKGRKKKDIIKVKILRPRKKSVSKEDNGELTRKASKLSICTDSGINGTESGISFPISNDTVELIHNHSETCLHANECLENSVEFVDASTTLISVNSNSLTTEWQDSRNFKDIDDMSLCSLNNNVKGALSCNNVECIQTYTSGNNNEAIFKSPAHDEILNSSLITEDLSDEAPAQPKVPALPSRWYLLSEEETTNTNIVSPPNSNKGGYGANLNEIFPITCAVPNLSTITEMSKENDSRKPFSLDSFSRDSNSRNIFL